MMLDVTRSTFAERGKSAVKLVGVDASLLDDRHPPVDLGLQVCAQGLWPPAFGRNRFGACRRQARLDGVVLQRFAQRAGELVDDRLRRALGRVHGEPMPACPAVTLSLPDFT